MLLYNGGDKMHIRERNELALLRKMKRVDTWEKYHVILE